MHNDNLNDNYIYWDDGSSIVIQNGNLQYNTKTELEYSYLGYLYGTMPYLTDETTENFLKQRFQVLIKKRLLNG